MTPLAVLPCSLLPPPFAGPWPVNGASAGTQRTGSLEAETPRDLIGEVPVHRQCSPKTRRPRGRSIDFAANNRHQRSSCNQLNSRRDRRKCRTTIGLPQEHRRALQATSPPLAALSHDEAAETPMIAES